MPSTYRVLNFVKCLQIWAFFRNFVPERVGVKVAREQPPPPRYQYCFTLKNYNYEKRDLHKFGC